jgi:DnaJ-class molecular chaperone
MQINSWHPDRFCQDMQQQMEATEKTKKIIEAYELLKDYTPPKASGPQSQSSDRFQNKNHNRPAQDNYKSRSTKQPFLHITIFKCGFRWLRFIKLHLTSPL